jgi:hypothetical protein
MAVEVGMNYREQQVRNYYQKQYLKSGRTRSGGFYGPDGKWVSDPEVASMTEQQAAELLPYVLGALTSETVVKLLDQHLDNNMKVQLWSLWEVRRTG